VCDKTYHDFLKLIEENADYPWFWVAVTKTFYFTGMRRRQLIALRWSDVSFENQTILLSVDGSKTRREWVIPIVEELLKELQQLKSYTENIAGQIQSKYIFDYITLCQAVQPLTGARVTRFYTELSKELAEGSDRVTPHCFRHTFATKLASGENPDLKSIQYLLGHTNIQTTLEYVEPDMQQMRMLVKEKI
jgi:integrase